MHPYNWFPLYPILTPCRVRRESHSLLDPTHIALQSQGFVLELRGDQVLAATLTLHPLLALLNVIITCNLNIHTGNVDYNELYKSTSFFQPLRPLVAIPYLHFSPMNILSWNTRGAGNADFRRAFKEMSRSYNPDLFILTETCISGDRTTNIISTLGYERYLKVDVVGFSGVFGFYEPHEHLS